MFFYRLIVCLVSSCVSKPQWACSEYTLNWILWNLLQLQRNQIPQDSQSMICILCWFLCFPVILICFLFFFSCSWQPKVFKDSLSQGARVLGRCDRPVHGCQRQETMYHWAKWTGKLDTLISMSLQGHVVPHFGLSPGWCSILLLVIVQLAVLGQILWPGL